MPWMEMNTQRSQLLHWHSRMVVSNSQISPQYKRQTQTMMSAVVSEKIFRQRYLTISLRAVRGIVRACWGRETWSLRPLPNQEFSLFGRL